MAEATEKNVTPKGWKAAGRRTKYGDWIKLETLKGYSVRPQKMSVEHEATLRRMELEQGSRLSPDIQRVNKRRAAEWKEAHPKEDREPSIMEIQELMTDAEWEKLAGVIVGAIMPPEMIRHCMLYGIAETDLDDEKGQPLKWTTELVDQLCEYSPVAHEIAEIAQRWNAPLPKGSAADS